MCGHLSRRGLGPRRGLACAWPCPLPGARRAGSSLLLGVAPDGVWPAAASPRRWCALTAPFHPCLFTPHVWARHRRSVSVPLSRGFRRVGVTDRPCPSVSGLSSRVTSRGRTAYAQQVYGARSGDSERRPSADPPRSRDLRSRRQRPLGLADPRPHGVEAAVDVHDLAADRRARGPRAGRAPRRRPRSRRSGPSRAARARAQAPASCVEPGDARGRRGRDRARPRPG